MRVYYRSSLFSYVPSMDGYSYDAYRATVFTFQRPARLKTLRRILGDYVRGILIEPKKAAWERRQVAASDSKGLGCGWVEISKLSYAGRRLVHPEERLAVWNLYAYETLDLRLGYSEFLGKAAQYGRDKRMRLDLGRAVKSFWEWLAS